MEWLVRLEFEAQSHEYSSFVTLTYNDDNLPSDGSLHKEDFQKFMKLFRFYSNKKYKYYAVGEYGDQTKRPHFHAIIFGLKPECDESRELVYESWKKCDEAIIKDPEHHSVGTCTKDSMLYVCDYMQKKQYGINAENEYGDKLPPFSLCSQGLGFSAFCNENIQNILKTGYLMYNSMKLPIPRYFRNKFDYKVPYIISDSDVYKKFCLEHELVSYDEVEYLDKQALIHRYNPYYHAIKTQCPEHLEELEKILKIKNNLRGSKL